MSSQESRAVARLPSRRQLDEIHSLIILRMVSLLENLKHDGCHNGDQYGKEQSEQGLPQVRVTETHGAHNSKEMTEPI